MNRIIITNDDQSFGISLSNFEYNTNYLQFELKIKTPIFEASKISSTWSDELYMLKDDLSDLLAKKIKELTFCPLGESWIVKLRLNGNSVDVEGSISYLEGVQSDLTFYNHSSMDKLSDALRQIDRVLSEFETIA